MSLADNDLGAILDVASALAAEEAPSFGVALDLLRSVIDCDIASFNDMTLASRDYRAVTRPSEFEALAHELKPVYDRFAHQHPLIQTTGTPVVMGAVRFCDVPDGDRVTETDLFKNFYEPFGIRYQLVIQLPSPPDVVVGYALSRGPSAGEFSDRDVDVINSLGAHLAMHHRTILNQQRATALSTETGWTVLSVRSDGVIDNSSSPLPGFPLAPGDRLPQVLAGLVPLGTALDAAPEARTVTIDDEQWRCVLRPAPAGPTLLMMRFAGDDVGTSAHLVDLGLTPRQIEVAMELSATGATNAQLARQLGITEGTVKKHLETVFSVLGVETRASAILALRDVTG